MNPRIHLAEVGFPHCHADVSLTGIHALSKTEGIVTPRLVIFEEGGDYQRNHKTYGKSVIAAGAEIFYGNIYEPMSLYSLPLLGLLILENVITDPSAHDQVWEGLLALLDIKIVIGGIILFIDHAFSTLTEEVYESLRKMVVQSSKFEILVDQVQQPDDFIFGTTSEALLSKETIVQVILSNLEQLDLLDQAVTEGLNTLDPKYKHVLILKKK